MRLNVSFFFAKVKRIVIQITLVKMTYSVEIIGKDGKRQESLRRKEGISKALVKYREFFSGSFGEYNFN